MRVATWNLQSDRALTPRREAAFRRAMDEVDADVWVLTETWGGFAPGPAYQWVAQSAAAADLPEGSDRRYVAIWSRVEAWLLQVYSEPDRVACIRIERGRA